MRLRTSTQKKTHQMTHQMTHQTTRQWMVNTTGEAKKP